MTRGVRTALAMLDLSPTATRRAEILVFFQTHGLAATRDAYHVGRSTLFSWQRALRAGGGRFFALEPDSRRPRHLRSPLTPASIVEAVGALRRAFPGMGKVKIAVLLQERGVRVSASTIGRILTRHPSWPDAPRRAINRRRRPRVRDRLPPDHVARQPGDLVSMDTVVVQRDGRRRYLLTALDHATRLAFARTYSAGSSKSAAALLSRVAIALGRAPALVLTDNGSEFHGAYHAACTAAGVHHVWTYPRSPKMNARTERFNRTIQEEASLPHVSASIDAWNAAVGHFCMVYNFFRPHAALSYRRPVEVYLAWAAARWPESKMLWTHTSA